MKKVLLVLCILFGLMMVNAGLNKLYPYMPMPEDIPEEVMAVMMAFGTIKWLMPLVAVAEIAGGILIAIPKTRALGAIVILPVMVGIILQHGIYDPAGMIIPLVMFAINIWAVLDSWKKYLPMVK